MGQYRLTKLARADLYAILRASSLRHGAKGQKKYRALLVAAMRRAADHPEGDTTVDRSNIRVGLRSLHIRHCKNESGEAPIRKPVHVIDYAPTRNLGFVRIVRILHERMDAEAHLGD